MKCKEAARLAEKYLYGALDEKAAAGYENHIAVCKACRSELELIRRLSADKDSYEAFQGIKAPDGFTDSVMSGIYGLIADRKLAPYGKPLPYSKPLPYCKLLPPGKPAAINNTGSGSSFPRRWRPVCPRLGVCLMLTGAIIVFTMLAPVAAGYPAVISGKIQTDVQDPGPNNIKNVLSGIDTSITGVFKSIGNSYCNKGGTGNGM